MPVSIEEFDEGAVEGETLKEGAGEGTGEGPTTIKLPYIGEHVASALPVTQPPPIDQNTSLV
jgi:hypothetical protein